MAEAAPFVVGIDTLAGATVSSDVGEEERSASGPRALSCQLAGKSALPTLVTNLRPLGQDCSPARPGEDRARPGVHTERMVREAKAAAAHIRPEERSTVATLRLCRQVSLLRGWAGKYDS